MKPIRNAGKILQKGQYRTGVWKPSGGAENAGVENAGVENAGATKYGKPSEKIL